MALANLTLSNPVPLVRTRHASGVPRNNWTTRWLFRTACAHIVTTGEALRHQVADIGVPMSQSTSVPSGVDTQRFHPGDKHRPGFIVVCRRTISGWAWYRICARTKAIAYCCAPGENRQSTHQAGDCRRRSAQSDAGTGNHRPGLQQRVVMAGHQSDPERWFPAFDIALSPSHDMEGVPQGVLQSLATRIATIATDAGGTGDAVINGQTECWSRSATKTRCTMP